MRVRSAFSYSLVVGACNLSLAFPARSQNSIPCSPTVVPISVATADGRVIRGLDESKFRARLQRNAVRVTTSKNDEPRRILLLIDGSNKITSDAWKLVVSLATRLVTNARPEDQFALATFGGPKETLSFSSNPDPLLAKLASWQAQRPGPKEDESYVYDALSEAAKFFEKPRYADGVFLLAGAADTRSRASFAQVLSALQERQIRVFGFVLTRYNTDHAGAAILVEELQTDPGTRDLAKLATQTGGSLFAENTKPFNRPFSLDQKKLDTLHQLAWRLYGQMVETYALQMREARQPYAELEVELTSDIQKKVPGVVALHARKLPSCQPAP